MIVLLVLLVACTTTTQVMQDDAMMEDGDVMEEKNNSMIDDTMEEDDAMMEDEVMVGDSMENNYMEDAMAEDAMYENTLAGSTTQYVEFSQEAYEKALSEEKVILLYFYASWCPTCKAEQPEIFEAFKSLNLENTIGFRVNYKDSDTDEFETALAKKYGIAYQHTKVILVNGEQVLKAPDSWKKDRYVSELTKVA